MSETIRQAVALAELECPSSSMDQPDPERGYLARGIHYASPRAQQPFVELDCSSLPEDVLAVELFGGGGPPDGSTGILTLAGRGTALLRQIQNLSSTLQSRLATTMAQGLEARILVSTKSSASDLMARGGLVPELGRLLGNAQIRVPSLTERDRDLMVIATRYCSTTG